MSDDLVTRLDRLIETETYIVPVSILREIRARLGRATEAPVLDYRADANEPLPTLPADSSRHSFPCKARGSIGANDPQECDWPVCGCDPYADRVIAALPVCGLLTNEHTRREVGEHIIAASNVADETLVIDGRVLVLSAPDGSVRIDLRKLCNALAKATAMTPAPRSDETEYEIGERITEAVLAAERATKTAIEHAYGILWRDVGRGSAEKSIAARNVLLAVLDKEGQRRGINHALELYGPVTDDEALENFP